MAVVGTLGDAVGEVNALAKHVAGYRRFGWRDLEAVFQNTGKVGGARSVPQENVIPE